MHFAYSNQNTTGLVCWEVASPSEVETWTMHYTIQTTANQMELNMTQTETNQIQPVTLKLELLMVSLLLVNLKQLQTNAWGKQVRLHSNNQRTTQSPASKLFGLQNHDQMMCNCYIERQCVLHGAFIVTFPFVCRNRNYQKFPCLGKW